MVSILVKNVGCSDNEKQEVKKDERRLRKAMAICDGSEGGRHRCQLPNYSK